VLVNLFDKPLSEAVPISIWLHLGTMLAAAVYFRGELLGLARKLPQHVAVFRTGSNRNSLLSFLFVSTLVTGVIGGPLFAFGLDEADIPSATATAAIGALLIITGLAQRFATRPSASRTEPGMGDAILLGAVQAISVIPGLSRSGLTVSAFLFRGYAADLAVRLSFLMSIPVILAAEVGLAAFRAVDINLAAISGVIAAFIFGILTIGVLVRLAGRVAFWKFCLLLGAAFSAAIAAYALRNRLIPQQQNR